MTATNSNSNSAPAVANSSDSSSQSSSRRDLVAIVWAPEEVRTELFARRLNATLHHIHFLEYKRPLYAPFKYPMQWLKTWQILFKERPNYIYITNPPVFAALCVYLFCAMTGAKFVMDTHPPSLYSKKWGWSLPLQRWIAKRALMNITDQERFQRMFEEWGAKCMVLEKPPKDAPFSQLTGVVDAGKFEVAVVNTFAEDEPFQPILDAANLLPDVEFHITGNLAKANAEQKAAMATAPANCHFTGYLLGDQYWSLLHRSRAVMVLTTFPYSLLGGGQDAMVLNKPAILSDQPALTDYFNKGAVFVENTAEGIAKGVQEVQQREQELIRGTQQLLEDRQQKWDTNFRNLTTLVGG
ncbi:MAG: hypothetical protein U0528_09795 [Anaerolineae bacterium]|nr:hypothetical protein [Anaerolineae bacterium]